MIDIFRAYRVAGHSFGTNLRVPGLERYALVAHKPWPKNRALDASPLAYPQRAFEGVSLVAGGPRQVECSWGPDGYRLEVESIGTFLIAADGRSIQAGGDLGSDDELVAQALVGPALILAMAQAGTFTFHASAVCRHGGVVAFVGQSGAGKSTLAGGLAEHPLRPWALVADDILPVALPNGGAPVCRLGYPQLELPQSSLEGLAVRSELPLVAVLVLKPGKEPEGNQLSLTFNEKAEAALSIVEQTVASRLFGAPLLAAHLSFCAELSRCARVGRLRYPWVEGSIDAVAELLESEITDRETRT